MSRYEGFNDSPFTVPFHEACQKMLLKQLGRDQLDSDVFYETMKTLAGEGGHNRYLGEVIYGDVGECMEQYWCTIKGTEWLIMSPLHIPELLTFFNNLPRMDRDSSSEIAARDPSQPDPFAGLAPEILVNIASSLSVKSLCDFRLASRVARNLELGNRFWRRRILSDMPWLFDLPEEDKTSVSVDWRRVYGKMLHASRPLSRTVIHGLANRRRIWEFMLPQFAKPYLKNLALRETDRAGEPESLANTRSTSLAVLADPEPKDSRMSTVALLDTPHSVLERLVDITVCFNKNDEISSIKALQTGRDPLQYDYSGIHRYERVSIPDTAWLTGFIFTCRGGRNCRPVGVEVLTTEGVPQKAGFTGEGGKRLIHVPRNQFVVGLRLHTSKKEDLLCRLGLIYHQAWRAGKGHERVWDHNNNNEELYNLHTTKCLWVNELPPPDLRATEPYHGYWSFDMRVETSPFEALLFPQNQADEEDLVAVAADVEFGGFELRFASRPTRAIGPKRQAMKVLTINGKVGEKLATVHICRHHIVSSIRITTTHGRQLVIGQPDDSEKQLCNGMDSLNEAPPNLTCGIFGFWKNRDSAQASLDSVGGLYHRHLVQTVFTDIAGKTGGLVWEPRTPPSDLQTEGAVIGAWQKTRTLSSQERAVPDDCNLLSWLDFSRPVKTLRVTMVHSLNTNQMPLVGIELSYADAERNEAAIGPSDFGPWTHQLSSQDGQRWCWCRLAGEKIEEEIDKEPHYQHHEWSVEGKHIAVLRIFLAKPSRLGNGKALEGAEGKAVTAIQFVAENGTPSPVWGYWGHQVDDEEIQEIEFGEGGDKAVGVKFFAGTNGRAVTREDHIVQAFQALVRVRDADE